MVHFIYRIMKKLQNEIDPSKVRALLIISIGCTIAGIFWGGIYALFGLYRGVIPPFIFSIVVGSALIHYRLKRNYYVLLYTQLTMVLVIPTVLQWAIGGFHKSGVVALWSLIAPFGAIIFQNTRKALFWVFIYLALILISLFMDSFFSARYPVATDGFMNKFFYGMNVITVSVVTFLAIYYYDRILQSEKRKQQQESQVLSEDVDVLLTAITDFSKGDLSLRIDRQSDNELSKKLFQGFNQSLEMLEDLFSDLKINTVNALKSIQTISTSISRLSSKLNANHELLNEVEEFIKATEKSLAKISQLAYNSSIQSQQNMSSAQKGTDSITKILVKFEEVTRATEMTREVVHDLELHTREIDASIAVINDISERTNLLALNAAIESARAGKYGKGFSVVSTEIGKLTGLTSDSTKKITEKIRQIQNKTKLAVENFNHNSNIIQEGLEITKMIGESTSEIMKKSSLLKQANTEMEEQSKKENEISEKMTQRVVEMLDNIKFFLKEIESVRKDSDELSEFAQNMSVAIDRIKIK